MSSNTGSTTQAKFRWKLLKRALLQHSLPKQNSDEIKSSVRRFNSFSLFQVSQNLEENSEVWKHEKTGLGVFIKNMDTNVQYSDITAFDNTGNICIWASEEVMAYYCIENIDLFQRKTICELGGGFSNLAGMFLSKAIDTTKILLTDGNEKSILNLQSLIAANNSNASSQVLRFDDVNSYAMHKDTFDVILSADCLFFDSFREHLATAIYILMKAGGTAYIFAPKRGKTFGEFVRIASEKFGNENVIIQEKYNDNIWKIHCRQLANNISEYDEDLHYPFLIKIKKT